VRSDKILLKGVTRETIQLCSTPLAVLAFLLQRAAKIEHNKYDELCYNKHCVECK
jgi:hypothetical protein